MNQPATETRSVVVERQMPHPPEKLWRALTQPHLIAEWLMKNDFQPVIGHRFRLRNDPQPGKRDSPSALRGVPRSPPGDRTPTSRSFWSGSSC